MDTVYYYHHPNEIPAKKSTQDGFYNPFEVVLEGWLERKRTGMTPDPDELSNRLKRRWKDDLDLLDKLIEDARPAPSPPPDAK